MLICCLGNRLCTNFGKVGNECGSIIMYHHASCVIARSSQDPRIWTSLENSYPLSTRSQSAQTAVSHSDTIHHAVGGFSFVF